jgi:hypothetical protein
MGSVCWALNLQLEIHGNIWMIRFVDDGMVIFMMEWNCNEFYATDYLSCLIIYFLHKGVLGS